MSGATRNNRVSGQTDGDAQNDYLAQVYARHAKTVYRLSYSFLGNAADAEDATQSVFMKLLAKPRSFSDVEHEKAWLIVCTQNHCRDVLKSAYRSQTQVGDDEALQNIATVDEDGDLKDAVLRLPERYKACVYLFYYEGYGSKEIGAMLDLPDSTVRTYLSEARKLLRTQLGGDRR